MTDQLVNEEEINQILAIVNLLTMIRSCFFLTQLDNTKPGLGQIHICVRYVTIHATYDKSIVNENHT